MTRSRAFGLAALSFLVGCKSAPGPVATPSPSVAEKPSAAATAAVASDPSCLWETWYPAPEYVGKEIPTEKLERCSLRELAILRNTIFARAGNIFRKHWLDEHFRTTGRDWYHPTGLDPKKLSPVDVKNAETIAMHEAKIPRSELERRRAAVLARPVPRSKEEEIELSLLSQALGEPETNDAEIVAKLSPLEAPERLDGLLTTDELSDFSRRDLRILRNTIYARRGRPFKSPILQDYFSRMKWYHADAKYSDARLTEVDAANIKIVLSVEESIGGPITDAQHDEDLHADMGQCA